MHGQDDAGVLVRIVAGNEHFAQIPEQSANVGLLGARVPDGFRHVTAMHRGQDR
jgi:hypothetical protein